MTKTDVLKGLTEVLFYLTICCYSEDPEQRQKVERMATSVTEARELILGLEDE